MSPSAAWRATSPEKSFLTEDELEAIAKGLSMEAHLFAGAWAASLELPIPDKDAVSWMVNRARNQWRQYSRIAADASQCSMRKQVDAEALNSISGAWPLSWNRSLPVAGRERADSGSTCEARRGFRAVASEAGDESTPHELFDRQD